MTEKMADKNEKSEQEQFYKIAGETISGIVWGAGLGSLIIVVFFVYLFFK